MCALYRIARQLYKTAPTRPPDIKDAQGNPVATSVDAAHRWLEYFAGIHSGSQADQEILFENQKSLRLTPRRE
eukprot:8865795-Alexandrium_andersonii.AAC.1